MSRPPSQLELRAPSIIALIIFMDVSIATIDWQTVNLRLTRDHSGSGGGELTDCLLGSSKSSSTSSSLTSHVLKVFSCILIDGWLA